MGDNADARTSKAIGTEEEGVRVSKMIENEETRESRQIKSESTRESKMNDNVQARTSKLKSQPTVPALDHHHLSLPPPPPEPTAEEVFKAFYDYNLWKLKQDYMASSKMGWTSLNGLSKAPSHPEGHQTSLVLNLGERSVEEEKQWFIKSCVLMAIREIVFDYFDQDFSFELAKISLTNPQFLITQDINVEWNVPKEIKGDIKKPMPKKPKKEKVKKEPKSKKDKSKSSKKGSKASKSTKASKAKKGKKGEKDKKSKKSDKKSKSSKGDKVKKLTKEEKAELDKQRKEQEELQRELFKQAENRMYMFPLKEAVDEKFFTDLFPNFKPKKGGAAKSAKSDKSSKSSKESKSTKKSKDKKKKK